MGGEPSTASSNARPRLVQRPLLGKSWRTYHGLGPGEVFFGPKLRSQACKIHFRLPQVPDISLACRCTCGRGSNSEDPWNPKIRRPGAPLRPQVRSGTPGCAGRLGTGSSGWRRSWRWRRIIQRSLHGAGYRAVHRIGGWRLGETLGLRARRSSKIKKFLASRWATFKQLEHTLTIFNLYKLYGSLLMNYCVSLVSPRNKNRWEMNLLFTCSPMASTVPTSCSLLRGSQTWSSIIRPERARAARATQRDPLQLLDPRWHQAPFGLSPTGPQANMACWARHPCKR